MSDVRIGEKRMKGLVADVGGGGGAKMAVGASPSQVIHKIIAGVLLETAAKASSDLAKMKAG